MGDASIPKPASATGFPVPNPTISYWQDPPHPIAHHRSTPELPTDTQDYIIIGSGVSGAAIAYKLLTRNPSLRILLLEARTAASGASGRNGGHCRPGWWLQFAQHVKLHGEDEALRFAALEEGNVADIAAFVAEHDVDCDFREVETSDVYVTEEEWQKVEANIKVREEVCQRRGADLLKPRKVFRGEEAQKAMGMPGIKGAVTYPAYTQNPHFLVCRMLELGIEKGLNLQTETPALEIKRVDGDEKVWEVRTERGTVRAGKVVLATNGYTNALYGDLAATEFLLPARSQVTAIRPGSNISGNPALQRSSGLNDIGSGDYFMSRAKGLRGEGDVLYGGGRWVSKTRERNTVDDSVIHEGIAKYLKEAGPKFFGRESWGEDGETVKDWSGITCYTPDTFPAVGQAPGKEGLWVSVGMNGHGMAMAFRCAEALVSLMTDGEEPDWFPRSFRLERAFKPSDGWAHHWGAALTKVEEERYFKPS